MGTCLKFKRFAVYFLLCCAILMISSGRLEAQAQPALAPAHGVSTLTVQITGLRNAKGKINLTLYRDSTFVQTRDIEIDAKTSSAKAVFEKIPQGIYAVYMFHDENMNGKMDTNFMGMPTEGCGMSNNPKKRMGRPGFNETNFQLNQPATTIEIKLIYWQ